MADPALSRPPHIPEGTFRCCLCCAVFPARDAWVDRTGQAWDMCTDCAEGEVPR